MRKRNPFQSDADYIAELETSLEASHKLHDVRITEIEALTAQIVQLGGESPPWDVHQDDQVQGS